MQVDYYVQYCVYNFKFLWGAIDFFLGFELKTILKTYFTDGLVYNWTEYVLIRTLKSVHVYMVRRMMYVGVGGNLCLCVLIVLVQVDSILPVS